MVAQTKYTIQDFEAYIRQPENADRLFELINGEIIEVSPGRTRNSEFGHLVAVAVHLFCRERKLPCHTSGGDGAYRVGENTVAPDFAYKPTPMSNDYPDPEPPLWVVEVISPTDEIGNIRAKRQIYRDAGILLWEMYPHVKEIEVYAPGQPVKTFGITETLDGGAVLPGFTLAVKDIFAE